MIRQLSGTPGLLILFISANITGIYGTICKESYSYLQAKRCCKEAGSSIISVYNNTDKLVAEMTKENIMSAWLSIERRTLRTFMWLNNQTANNTALSNNIYSNRSCGIFNKQNTEVTAEHCSKSVGHICEKLSCTDCNTLGWDSVVCQQAGTSCFIFSCDNTNWYDARLRCERKGQRLAIISSKAKKTAVSRGDYACNRFWVGVRSEDWLQSEDTIQPIVSFWDVNEPSDLGNCTAMFVAGTSHKLTVQPCDKRRHVICKDVYSSVATTVEVPGEGDKLIYIIIGVVVVVLLGISVVSCMLWRKRFCKTTTDGNGKVEEENLMKNDGTKEQAGHDTNQHNVEEPSNISGGEATMSADETDSRDIRSSGDGCEAKDQNNDKVRSPRNVKLMAREYEEKIESHNTKT